MKIAEAEVDTDGAPGEKTYVAICHRQPSGPDLLLL